MSVKRQTFGCLACTRNQSEGRTPYETGEDPAQERFSGCDYQTPIRARRATPP